MEEKKEEDWTSTLVVSGFSLIVLYGLYLLLRKKPGVVIDFEQWKRENGYSTRRPKRDN
jgi:hypothetical protein